MASFDQADNTEVQEGVRAFLTLCDPTYWIVQSVEVATDVAFEFWKGCAQMAVTARMAEMP